jgi:hypothetical protein
MEGAHLHVARQVTRWLVYDGTISLEGIRCVPLAVEATVWILAVLGSIVAIVLTCRTTLRGPTISYILAGTALVVGYLGLLTPFPFFPRIGFCQADGESQFAFELNRLFGAPLALGAVALVGAISGNVICPSCHNPTISFRQFWLRSSWRAQRCSGCGAVCRLKHPARFTALGVGSAMAVLAVGYVVAGYGGFLALIPVALALDAWVDFHTIRSLKLLKVSDH